MLTSLIPHSIRKNILRLGMALAKDEFFVAAHERANAPDQNLSLSALAQRGFSPKLIVDVGAYEGEWSRMVKQIWPSSDLILIEPNKEKQLKLKQVAQDLKATYFQDLIGAKTGDRVEFELLETGSSVYPEQSDIDRASEMREIQTLDEITKGQSVDFLKIDTQGYELEVLKGATQTIKNTKAILLELSFIDINMGAPLILDFLNYLNDRNFLMYDILEFHRRPSDRVLWQIDCLLVPKTSFLREDKKFS